MVKSCPDKKPLYNPITKRCVLDNPSNRKKNGLIDTRKVKINTHTNKTRKMGPTKSAIRKISPKKERKGKFGVSNGSNVTNANKTVQSIMALKYSKQYKSIKPTKICPQKKPLYNPKTKRCILDNPSNRKKLGLPKKQPDVHIPTPKEILVGTKTELGTDSGVGSDVGVDVGLPEKKSLTRDSLERYIPVKLTQKTYSNIWEGSDIRNLMGLYYLYTKHNSFMCYVPENIVDTEHKLRLTTNGFLFSTFKQSDIRHVWKTFSGIPYEVGSLCAKKDDIITEIRVHKSFNLKASINKCRKNKKRFFIGFIILRNLVFNANGSYNNRYSTSHANSFMYDTKLKTLELFEPHGELSKKYTEKYGPERITLLKEYFKVCEIPVKEFISSADFCPMRKGPQLYDALSGKKFVNPNMGYCAAWSIFYLDMRLKYPDEDRYKLMVKVLDTFKNYTDVYINAYSRKIINSVIKGIPSVKEFLKDKERMKRFKKIADVSVAERRDKHADEQVISSMILSEISGCK